MNKDKKSNNDPTELSDLIADDLPKGVKYVLSEILGFKSYKKDLDRYCSLTGLNITKIGYEEDAGEAYPLFEFTNGEKIGIEEIRGRLIEYIKEVIKEENHIIINDTFESKKKKLNEIILNDQGIIKEYAYRYQSLFHSIVDTGEKIYYQFRKSNEKNPHTIIQREMMISVICN